MGCRSVLIVNYSTGSRRALEMVLKTSFFGFYKLVYFCFYKQPLKT